MRGSAVAGVAVAAVVRNEREKSTKECMYIYVCVCVEWELREHE